MGSEHGVQELYGQAGMAVLEGKLQGLRFIICFSIDGREPFQCGLAGDDLIAGISKLSDPCAVGQLYLIGGPAEIAGSVLRIFLGNGIQ
ncbi:hypothetical protein D3C73_1555980 [compost metagenome]